MTSGYGFGDGSRDAAHPQGYSGAFGGHTSLPDLSALANQDPARLAALFQQLQEAGFPLPAGSPSIPPPYDPTNALQLPPHNTGGGQPEQSVVGKQTSEEGEFSEEGEVSGGDDMSTYDPEEQTFGTPPVPVKMHHEQPSQPHSTGFEGGGLPGQVTSHLFHNNTSHANDAYPTAHSQDLDSPGQPDAAPVQQHIKNMIQGLSVSDALSKSFKPLSDQLIDVRNFLSLLEVYGYTFNTLRRENSYFDSKTDWDLLASLYKDQTLGQVPSSKPVEVALPPTLPVSQRDQSSARDWSALASATPLLQTNGHSLATAQPSRIIPAVSKLGGGVESRAAYLAKLKAAKMKVARPIDSGVKSSSASATPPVQPIAQDLPTAATNSSAGVTRHDVAKPAQPPTSVEDAARVQAETSARKKRQNELLQQRLAALKAKQGILTPITATGGAPPPTQVSTQTSGQVGIRPDPPANGQRPTTPIDERVIAPVAAGRKRPVAADFEDFAATTGRSTKHLRSSSDDSDYDRNTAYEHMVIEVSDEEDSEDGGVDVEDDIEELINSTANAAGAQSSSKLPYKYAKRNPAQALSSSTSSAQGTPTSMAGRAGLSQMELQIAEMKAKIAASEALKRRKIATSRPETPHILPPTRSRTDAIDPELARSSASGRESPAEHRLRRRADIESIDARVASNFSKIEQLRLEMARLEAENERELEEKSALSKELEQLGVDTGGMDKQEMVAIREDIRQQQQMEKESAAASDPMQVDEQDDQESASPSASSSGSSTRPALEQGKQEPITSAFTAKLPTTSTLMPAMPQEMAEGSNSSSPESTKTADYPPPEQSPATTGAHIISRGLSADEHADDTGAEDATDDEDLYAPRPTATSDQASRSEASNEAFEMSEDEDTNENPLELSVAPLVEQARSSTSDQPVSLHTHEDSDDDDELYSAAPAVPTRFGLTQASIQNQETNEDVVTDLGMSPSPAPSVENMPGASAQQHRRSEAEGSLSRAGLREPSASIDDASAGNPGEGLGFDSADVPVFYSNSDAGGSLGTDGAQQMGTQQAFTLIAPEAPAGVMPSNIQQSFDTTDEGHYHPYSSPLKMFKAYRYHPQFPSDVQGGFRSMTYSHQIDPDRTLCPYEAEGGICNDPDCTGQHFRGMELSDDMILVQMGATNPGRSSEEKSKWNAGLRTLLMQLGAAGTRDASTMAAAIAEYRRTFLADPTKVLNL